MRSLTVVLLSLMLLTSFLGCTPKSSQVDPNIIYTEAALTVQAQLTNAAASIPTATASNTHEPTLPPTATEIPLPTTTATPAPTPTWVFNPAGKVIAPILLYPRIADSTDDDANYQWESSLSVGRVAFRQQMATLYEAGYTTIPVSLIVEGVWNGTELPPRPVAITFDGSSIGVYKIAYPIMKEYGFVGTIFVASSHVDGSWMMSTSQLQELIAEGWEVGSKGYRAVNLVDNYSSLSDEIAYSKSDLEDKLKTTVTIFSYPFGAMDQGIVTRVSEWGYKGAVGVFPSSEHNMGTIYYMARYPVSRDTTIDKFVSYLPWQPSVIPTQASSETVTAGTVDPASSLTVTVTP